MEQVKEKYCVRTAYASKEHARLKIAHIKRKKCRTSHRTYREMLCPKCGFWHVNSTNGKGVK